MDEDLFGRGVQHAGKQPAIAQGRKVSRHPDGQDRWWAAGSTQRQVNRTHGTAGMHHSRPQPAARQHTSVVGGVHDEVPHKLIVGLPLPRPLLRLLHLRGSHLGPLARQAVQRALAVGKVVVGAPLANRLAAAPAQQQAAAATLELVAVLQGRGVEGTGLNTLQIINDYWR